MDTNEPKITANKQKKIEAVVKLSEKFAKANAVVFTNYGGLTHKQIEELKKAIKPFQAEFVVAKNSLLTIALSENKMTLSENLSLQGPTGTLFLYGDIVSPLKSLAKTIKELKPDRYNINLIAQKFIQLKQLDFAQKTYQKGKEVLKDKNAFNLEIAKMIWI
jgi:large subunit ribosomal protein L10